MKLSSEAVERRIHIGIRVGVLATVVVLLLGGYVRWGVIEEAKEMLATGKPEMAKVVDKKHWTEAGRKGREIDEYALVYEFKDTSGVAHRGDISVHESEYLGTAIGGDVPILYSIRDPKVSDTVERYKTNASLVDAIVSLSIVAAVMLGITFGAAYFARLKMRAAR